MSSPWYDIIVAADPITQGDLIADCPLLTWNTNAITPQAGVPPQGLQQAVSAFRADVVVMTQACDLEHEKVRNVILCPTVTLEEYRIAFEQAVREQGNNPTAKAWRRHCDDIRDGYLWNLAMLNAEAHSALPAPHRVVDFHEVFTLPLEFLEAYLMQRGQPRLRLSPPYREHLSQAFARFFMRVGLPTPVSRVW
jgi:hypothetical protein